jgi:hypothetical protein
MPAAVGTDRPDRRAFGELGWDPTWMLGLGGGARLASPAGRARVDLDAAAFLPVLLAPSARAWQLAAGVTAGWVHRSGLGVSAGLHPDFRSSADSVASMFGVGGTVTCRPGYYQPAASVALDASWSAVVANHVSLREPVRDLFRDRHGADVVGSGPRDGLYAWTAHRFRLGATGGWAPTRSLALHGAVGWTHTPQLAGAVNPPYGPMPFYVSAGGAYRW